MGNVTADRAYEYIRKQIIGGAYQPGKSLLIKNLSDEIGVSRTPVRDALRQLELDGLVSIRPRLGASVKSMDLKEFEDMNELRFALECHAVVLAAQRRTKADLEAIKAPLDAFRTAIDAHAANDHSGDDLPEGVLREDIQFHVAIVDASRNDLIKKEIFRLNLIHRVVSAPATFARGQYYYSKRIEPAIKRRQFAEEHGEIYEAILRGDATAARGAMERHLHNNIYADLFTMPGSNKGSGVKEMT